MKTRGGKQEDRKERRCHLLPEIETSARKERRMDRRRAHTPHLRKTRTRTKKKTDVHYKQRQQTSMDAGSCCCIAVAVAVVVAAVAAAVAAVEVVGSYWTWY